MRNVDSSLGGQSRARIPSPHALHLHGERDRVRGGRSRFGSLPPLTQPSPRKDGERETRLAPRVLQDRRIVQHAVDVFVDVRVAGA